MLRTIFCLLALALLSSCIPTDWANLKARCRCVSTRLVILDKTKSKAEITVEGCGLDFTVNVDEKKVIDLPSGEYLVCRPSIQKCHSFKMACGVIYKIEV